MLSRSLLLLLVSLSSLNMYMAFPTGLQFSSDSVTQIRRLAEERAKQQRILELDQNPEMTGQLNDIVSEMIQIQRKQTRFNTGSEDGFLSYHPIAPPLYARSASFLDNFVGEQRKLLNGEDVVARPGK